MKRAKLIIAFLFAALARLSAKELTLEEYQILGAVVEEDAIHAVRGSVYVWHLVEPVSAISPGGIRSALSSFPEAPPTAKAWESEPVELDVHRLNFIVDSTPHRFIKPQSIKLLDEAPALQTPTAIWFMSPAIIPDADSIVRLSRPAVREDRRVAFVILARCDKWTGSVVDQELDKDPVSGRWRLGGSGRRSFTSWKNSSVFEYRGPESLKSSSDCH